VLNYIKSERARQSARTREGEESETDLIRENKLPFRPFPRCDGVSRLRRIRVNHALDSHDLRNLTRSVDSSEVEASGNAAFGTLGELGDDGVTSLDGGTDRRGQYRVSERE
jgi:hypothetical protein